MKAELPSLRTPKTLIQDVKAEHSMHGSGALDTSIGALAEQWETSQKSSYNLERLGELPTRTHTKHTVRVATRPTYTRISPIGSRQPADSVQPVATIELIISLAATGATALGHQLQRLLSYGLALIAFISSAWHAVPWRPTKYTASKGVRTDLHTKTIGRLGRYGAPLLAIGAIAFGAVLLWPLSLHTYNLMYPHRDHISVRPSNFTAQGPSASSGTNGGAASSDLSHQTNSMSVAPVSNMTLAPTVTPSQVASTALSTPIVTPVITPTAPVDTSPVTGGLGGGTNPITPVTSGSGDTGTGATGVTTGNSSDGSTVVVTVPPVSTPVVATPPVTVGL